jgi:hypothetical protein
MAKESSGFNFDLSFLLIKKYYNYLIENLLIFKKKTKRILEYKI